MTQTLLKIYAVLVSTIFGIAFTAQILSFLGVYQAFIAIPLTIIVSILAFIVYQKLGSSWRSIFSIQDSTSILSKVVILVAIALVLVIFLQRMVLWSQSSLGIFISPDFVGYHGVKALQLYYVGSSWDLAIPYGQYPFGYESLIAFGMFLTGDIRITGTIHALIFVVFWLTITLLILRYARLSVDTSLFLALMLCFVPIIFPQLLNVGKNDGLLSLTILMAILFAPIGDDHFHPLGLAFATMLSLATKTTGLLVLFYVWGLVLLNWSLHLRQNTWRTYLRPSTFMLAIILMFPGGLWVIRNYIVMNQVVSSEISSFFQTSIFANLDNPTLYNSADSNSLWFALILIIVLSIVALFYKHLRWQWSTLLLVVALSFAITPLSAFLTLNDLDYLDVQWRFVLYGIVIVWVTGIIIFAPLIRIIYTWVNDHVLVRYFASVLLVIASVGLVLVIGLDDIFAYDDTQWEQVIDPDSQDNSIYDEIRTLEASVIYLENVSWLSVFLSNPDLTITELRYPLGHADIYSTPDIEYIAFSPRFSDDPLAPIFEQYEWERIFESSTGSLYQRVR